MNRTLLGATSAILYITTVFAANYAIQKYGFVPVGFGLLAPAGVYFVGVAFTLRDTTQAILGRRVVVGCILVGAFASWWVSPRFAIASAAAFLVSEIADFAVYTPLAEKGWLRAVVASNLVGLVADSVLFLWLAFGSLAFLDGQIVGKAWMTLAALPVAYLIRSRIEQAQTRVVA